MLFKSIYKKKKMKVEEEMRLIMAYNEYVTEEYNVYPETKPQPRELARFQGLAAGYSEDVWPKMKKYGVGKELFDNHIQSRKIAIDAYIKYLVKIEKSNKENKERNQIELYKRAILELKEEGKLT